jgi:hypothetical protein
MKVVLEYQLPEETEEYELAMDGNKRSCALSQIDNALRAVVKYENFSMFTSEFTAEELESDKYKDIIIAATLAIRQRISDILIESGINS